MEKFYKISEDELVSLIATWHKFNALFCGGVDNWDRCEDAFGDYKDSWKVGHGWTDSLTFDDIAETELEFYTEVE